MERHSNVRRFVGTNTSAYKKYAKKYRKATVKKYRKAGKKISKKKLGMKTFRKWQSKMGSCTARYIESQYNPFKEYSPPVCVPDFISMPSYKFSTKARGNIIFNASGLAYILMNAYLPTNGEDSTVPIANNRAYCAPIWASNGGTQNANPVVIPTSLLTKDSTLKTVTDTCATPVYWDSPINAAAAINALRGDGNWDWRPVSGGVKIKYAGDVMKRKGQVVLYEEPMNGSSLTENSQSQAGLLQAVEATFTAFGDQEYAVTYHPRTLSDLDYASSWHSQNMQGDLNELVDYACLLIAVYGGPANESCVFEAKMHWEMTGRLVPSRSKSDSDPAGFAAAQAIIPSKPSTAPPATQASIKGAQAAGELGGQSGTAPVAYQPPPSGLNPDVDPFAQGMRGDSWF